MRIRGSTFCFPSGSRSKFPPHDAGSPVGQFNGNPNCCGQHINYWDWQDFRPNAHLTRSRWDGKSQRTHRRKCSQKVLRSLAKTGPSCKSRLRIQYKLIQEQQVCKFGTCIQFLYTTQIFDETISKVNSLSGFQELQRAHNILVPDSISSCRSGLRD